MSDVLVGLLFFLSLGFGLMTALFFQAERELAAMRERFERFGRFPPMQQTPSAFFRDRACREK